MRTLGLAQSGLSDQHETEVATLKQLATSVALFVGTVIPADAQQRETALQIKNTGELPFVYLSITAPPIDFSYAYETRQAANGPAQVDWQSESREDSHADTQKSG